MYKVNKIKTLVLVSAIIITLSFSMIAPIAQNEINKEPAKFAIAWTYDGISGSASFDEYGQGFYEYYVSENVSSPPNWINVGGIRYFNQSTVIEWEVGVPIQIRIFCFFNSTLTGAPTLDDGLNYQRINVTVTGFLNEVMYEEDDITNFYKTSFFDAEMWLYGYETVLGFLPEEGVTYSVTFTYEIYW